MLTHASSKIASQRFCLLVFFKIDDGLQQPQTILSQVSCRRRQSELLCNNKVSIRGLGSIPRYKPVSTVSSLWATWAFFHNIYSCYTVQIMTFILYHEHKVIVWHLRNLVIVKQEITSYRSKQQNRSTKRWKREGGAAW